MLPVFIGYTTNMRVGVQRWLAVFVSITVLGLMLLFLFAGTALLNFFGITLDAFRIAGGILLLLIGIRTVAHDPANKAKISPSHRRSASSRRPSLSTARSLSLLRCRYWLDQA